MPNIISLAAYLLKIRDVNAREDEVLSELEGERDFLDYLDDRLKEMTETKHNKEHQQVLSVRRRSKHGRRLSGIIETGQYGIESNIYSVPKKTVVYTRKTEEADMLPFYFLFDVPEGTDEGLLVLQRTGNFGIRKILHRFLNESFMVDYPDLRFRLDPTIDQEHLDQYEHGLFKEVRFLKIFLPSDVADSFKSGHVENRGTVELVFKATRGGSLPDRLRERIARQLRRRDRSGVYAIDDIHFEYNDVKVRSQVGGTKRLFRIGDPKVRSYYDVTENVRIASSGHPTWDSISDAAEGLADRLKSRMYRAGSGNED